MGCFKLARRAGAEARVVTAGRHGCGVPRSVVFSTFFATRLVNARPISLLTLSLLRLLDSKFPGYSLWI